MIAPLALPTGHHFLFPPISRARLSRNRTDATHASRTAALNGHIPFPSTSHRRFCQTRFPSVSCFSILVQPPNHLHDRQRSVFVQKILLRGKSFRCGWLPRRTNSLVEPCLGARAVPSSVVVTLLSETRNAQCCRCGPRQRRFAHFTVLTRQEKVCAGLVPRMDEGRSTSEPGVESVCDAISRFRPHRDCQGNLPLVFS